MKIDIKLIAIIILIAVCAYMFFFPANRGSNKEIKRLEKENKELAERNNQLEKEINKQDKKIISLENEIKHKKQELDNTQAEIDSLKGSLTYIDTVIVKIKNRNNEHILTYDEKKLVDFYEKY